MAKTAAKKRPPARAMATARSAPKKSRTVLKKPAVNKAARAKTRPVSKATKKSPRKALRKNPNKTVARRTVVSRKPAKPTTNKTAKKIAKKVTKSKPIAKKPATQTVVKKVVVAAKSAVKAVAKVISPRLNSETKNGFVKPIATPVSAAKSSAPVKMSAKATIVKAEPVLIPDSRVATNQKPRKNQAGLGVKELDNFRALLLEKRREILGDMHSMENEALGYSGKSASPVNVTDMGTDNYEQEFTLGLVEKDRVLLREINNALAKIQNGTYGICEGTGNAIGKPRLEVQPWARFSIEFARLRERNGMGIR